MKHSLLILTCVVSLAGSGWAATPTETIRAARKKAASKPRPIIINNDGNDTRPDDEPTRENFLKRRAAPLARTKTKTLFYCAGVWGTFTFPSPVAELRDHRDRAVPEWAAHLSKDGGPDSLGTMIEFCHGHGIEVFWSLRMNDTHDSADPTMLNQWKKDHPELLLGKHGVRYPAGARRWSAANYEHEVVRDRVVAWFEDVARRYDVDGFELDF
ncbi:MAG: family 10 glycosylhydrolase, partial [Pirellulales bacterium]|nr:family 10 glycosylhydrolase [Pirellulales bacterium]